VLLAVGLATALFGVVFAAVQVDMKRLLAYSSIENIGLLFTGIGLAVLFSTYGMQPMAALALTAVLYHVASHAFFKSLLFIGTGAVLHATRTQPRQARWPDPLHALGGLGYMLAVLASAGLPPLGGFVSSGCCCKASCSHRLAEFRSSTC
jgi:hydrogenase-4 component B